MYPPFHFTSFSAGTQATAHWEPWSPRAEIAPCAEVRNVAGHAGTGVLALSAQGNPAAYGAWKTRAEVEAGHVYRLSAWYCATGIRYEKQSIWARLDWRDAQGKRLRAPDYAVPAGRDGKWERLEHVAPAPEHAASVEIELGLGWAPKADLLWDDVAFEELPAMPARIIRVAAVNYRPRYPSTTEKNLDSFCRMAEKAAPEKPDLICLPEGITVVSTDKSYADAAEPVPGPTTERLGKLAAKLHSYVVAGIYEREGKVVYNTAVLMGRKGELVGKYRKTHLPYEEFEKGLTPGDEYPVFDTDFGKLGMIICYDAQFPEPARAMAIQGAEVLALPIWGGSDGLVHARAEENCLYLVASSYDLPTQVIGPDGTTLAKASTRNPLAFAEIDLARKVLQPWVGDMKPRTWRERRPDLPLESAAP